MRDEHRVEAPERRAVYGGADPQQWSDPVPKHRVGEHPSAVELDQRGRMAEPRDRKRLGFSSLRWVDRSTRGRRTQGHPPRARAQGLLAASGTRYCPPPSNARFCSSNSASVRMPWSRSSARSLSRATASADRPPVGALGWGGGAYCWGGGGSAASLAPAARLPAAYPAPPTTAALSRGRRLLTKGMACLLFGYGRKREPKRQRDLGGRRDGAWPSDLRSDGKQHADDVLGRDAFLQRVCDLPRV